VWWSRVGAYDRAEVDRILWQDRSMFHYWAHAASLVLTEDLPIHRHQMRTWPGTSSWTERVGAWMKENDALRRHILSSLRRRGPLTSSDFDDVSTKAWASEGWTGGRNVSRMLDFLWAQGKVMIAGRASNRRVYDLAERFFPDDAPTNVLGPRAMTRAAARFALDALGIATAKQIKLHFIRNDYIDLQRELDVLVAEGAAIPAEVPGMPGTWYLSPGAEDRLNEERSRTTLLSPFDNLICDRVRTKLLFDFDYTIEIYVPRPKRRYGYYSMPILHEGRLIGRLDPALDRKKAVLKLNSIHLEPGPWANSLTGRAVGAAVGDLAHFVGAERLELPDGVPRGWRSALRSAV
jgi:uncharacterized protein YcaQ